MPRPDRDDDAPALPSAPPDVDRLAALDDALWRRIVPHVRLALRDLPDHGAPPRTRQLVAAPARRLVSGRARRDVQDLLAGGGELWVALRRRLASDPGLTSDLAGALEAAPAPAAPAEPSDVPATGDEQVERLRARLRGALEERDEARRRADGEGARADREARARAAADRRVQELQERVAALERRVTDAEGAQAAAVERERRRGRAEVARVRDQLRALRREREEEARRAVASQQAQAVAAAQSAATPAPAPAPPRLVPGRPSRLPSGVHPETTEAADLLLHAGRRVLVDGYNVTRTHQAAQDLEGQRRWLLNRLATAVASRRIEPVVVFDGHATAGRGGGRIERGVRVVFTPYGVTADDDLVFQAEAADPAIPLVVVTDDRELRDRLRPFGVDLLSTGAFLGAVR